MNKKNKKYISSVYENEIKETFLKCIKRRPHWSKMKNRRIRTNEVDYEIPDNTISTSKYTYATFLPKNLLEQFSKTANLYFLVMAFLQMIPAASNTNGQPLIFIPLSVIVSISMGKDFYEDWKRKRSDNEENNRKCLVLDEGKFIKKAWKEVMVGSICKIQQDEFFPADMLLLKSSSSKGTAYIETKNLDGETNLKFKCANKDLAEKFGNDNMCEQNRFWFEYEKPSPYLGQFNGNMDLEGEFKVSLDSQNFLLRGCSLRNTEWIIGLCAYNGHDTKIILNSVRAKAKKSHLERKMDRQILLVFFIQLLFCFGCSVARVAIYENKKKQFDYLEFEPEGLEKNVVSHFFVSFGTWLLLVQNFVPISLMVTLEMVKFFQGIIISKDHNMYSSVSQCFTAVQSSNLNEELGQIHHIFSDKTGTLTCNIMDFKNICINGVSYGGKTKTPAYEAARSKIDNVDFCDEAFFSDFNDKSNSLSPAIEENLILLASCHSIIIEEKNGNINYNASSPDELALVNFARYCGYTYIGLSERNEIQINIAPEEKIVKYELLHTLEFNSTRKRMSVILRSPDGKILLFCKGADSIIYARMKDNGKYLAYTKKILYNYAVKGLRTLVLSKKIIPEKDYQKWNTRYKNAQALIMNREKELESLQEEIEQGLELVGATAIEDKLQDDVATTISFLQKAGIKIWVLTGDKVETAINIGYSCALLSEKMKINIIDDESEDTLKIKLFDTEQKYNNELKEERPSPMALVVTGDSLIHIMKSSDHSKRIVQLAEDSQAVIACRVSPKQKQEVVSLVRKENPKLVTLAIGDGANDVNMIIAAHVGIGIKGLEGQQAARASDYAIGEFKILRRLLFYCGRESYRKNCFLIGYNFYKNMVLVLPGFWFAFFNNFSAQLLYDPWIFQFFNLFYAALPIILYALFDEEFPSSSEYLNIIKAPRNILETSPKLYELGMKDTLFNTKEFWLWIFNGVWHAIIVTYGSVYPIEESFIDKSSGLSGHFFGSGMMMFTNVVTIVNLKILLFTHTHYNFTLMVVFLSIAFYLLNYYISSVITWLESYNGFQLLFQSANFYLGSLVTYGLTLLIDYAWINYRTLFRVVQEKELDVGKLSGEALRLYLKEKRAKVPLPLEEEKTLSREASEPMKIEPDADSKGIMPMQIEFMSKLPHKPNSTEDFEKGRSFIFNPGEINERKESVADGMKGPPPLFDEEVYRKKSSFRNNNPNEDNNKHSQGSKIESYQSRTPLTKSDVDIKSASIHQNQESNKDDSIYHFD